MGCDTVHPVPQKGLLSLNLPCYPLETVTELEAQIWREGSGENSTKSLEKDGQQETFHTKRMSAVLCLSRNRVERGLLIPTPRPPKDLWLDQEVPASPSQGLTCVCRGLAESGVRRYWSTGCVAPHTRPLRLASESLFLGSDLLTLTLCAAQSEMRPMASACKLICQCDLKPLTLGVLYLEPTHLFLAQPQRQDMWPPRGEGDRQGDFPALFS